MSCQSDGYNTYASMIISRRSRPAIGRPAIIFSYGRIRPSEHGTTGCWVVYVDRIARNGSGVFKPDLLRHGDPEGCHAVEGGSYSTPAYALDDVDALVSLSAAVDNQPRHCTSIPVISTTLASILLSLCSVP